MSGIELAGVSKAYGPVFALNEVSLAVSQGEFVTILGPSGSGKTTLLNVIAGLSLPSGGTISIGGRDVTALPAAQRNVGLVFQSYALFPHMSVRENVAFPLSIRHFGRSEIQRRVKDALQMVRLSGYQDRRPSELSGGQQQRVALARAFVFEPDILLLDEPLAALDRKLRQELQVELKQLHRSVGITTVLVTHDQDEALSLSDRLVVLSGGAVQQVGSPEESYRRPANRFVADFLGTANFLVGTFGQDSAGVGRLMLQTGDTVLCGTKEDGASEAAPPFSSDATWRRAEPTLWLIRPERIRVEGSDTGQGVDAVIREVIYLGQSIRYHLKLRDGTEMVAVSAERSVRFGPDCPVRVTWGAEDMWPIPAESAATGGQSRADSPLASIQ